MMLRYKGLNDNLGRKPGQDEQDGQDGQDGQDAEMEDQELQKALVKICRLFVSVSAIPVGETFWL